MKSELARSIRDLRLSAQLVDPLWSYLQLLANWNEMFNLTAIPSERWVQRHIVDSLSLLPFLQGAGRCADLGSGAGLPGVPLALALPQLRWTLIEKNLKRASFLSRVKSELLLSNVEVVHKRAEDVHPTELFRYITARAVGRCARLCQLALPLLVCGGQLLAMKGRLGQVELDEVTAPWQLQRVHRISYPSTANSAAEVARNLSVAIWKKGE